VVRAFRADQTEHHAHLFVRRERLVERHREVSPVEFVISHVSSITRSGGNLAVDVGEGLGYGKSEARFDRVIFFADGRGLYVNAIVALTPTTSRKRKKARQPDKYKSQTLTSVILMHVFPVIQCQREVRQSANVWSRTFVFYEKTLLKSIGSFFSIDLRGDTKAHFCSKL